MKSRLKKKNRNKKTSNTAIKLLDWERNLLKAMEGDCNPTFGKIRGAIQVGRVQEEGSELYTERSEQTVSISAPAIQKTLPPKRKLATEKYETEETKGLTTKELQRLVLLQQYQTSILQQEYYKTKLEMMERQKPPVTYDVHENKTYYNL